MLHSEGYGNYSNLGARNFKSPSTRKALQTNPVGVYMELQQSNTAMLWLCWDAEIWISLSFS